MIPKEVWIVEFKDGAWQAFMEDPSRYAWPHIKNVYRLELDWRLLKNDN